VRINPAGFCVPGPDLVPEAWMLDIQVGLHVFFIVLVLGTIWRLSQYHLIAAQSPWLQHLGIAMALQY
jgi:hypothetical protein